MHDQLIDMIKVTRDDREQLAFKGHPIYILMAEHEQIIDVLNQLTQLVKLINAGNHIVESDKDFKELLRLNAILNQAESHYQREEIVLFSYLEKHGLSGPPKAMWMEHDQIRGYKKELNRVIDQINDVEFLKFTSDLSEISEQLVTVFMSHFHKEDNILFEAAMRLINHLEWIEIRNQFDEIGYLAITPESAIIPMEGQNELDEPMIAQGGFVADTGELSADQLDMILNTLPIDLTFIDEDDTVRYFNQHADQIFPRTKASIGRKVQNCHPEKSVHLVNQILDDFKNGVKDMVDFWIDMNGRKIYIRYFAVRNKSGTYMGCVESTQDITAIKRISGVKRLI